MRFVETKLPGAFLIEPEPFQDERGLFARTFCALEFSRQGLTTQFVQCSTSFSRLRGTLRGLHYQLQPATEVKLIRCTAGAIQGVVVDLRPESATYAEHITVELSAENRRALYIPEMFANGYQTLADSAEVFYQISEYYAPDHAAGVRYDDPKLGIRWPLPISTISEKDRTWPLL
jgi:dTDP-4-dehydrorhamnose 3,5-epimerase